MTNRRKNYNYLPLCVKRFLYFVQASLMVATLPPFLCKLNQEYKEAWANGWRAPCILYRGLDKVFSVVYGHSSSSSSRLSRHTRLYLRMGSWIRPVAGHMTACRVFSVKYRRHWKFLTVNCSKWEIM